MERTAPSEYPRDAVYAVLSPFGSPGEEWQYDSGDDAVSEADGGCWARVWVWIPAEVLEEEKDEGCYLCGATCVVLESVSGCPRCDWGTLPKYEGAPVFCSDDDGVLYIFFAYPEQGCYYAVHPYEPKALIIAPMLSGGRIEHDVQSWSEAAWGCMDEDVEVDARRILEEVRQKTAEVNA